MKGPRTGTVDYSSTTNIYIYIYVKTWTSRVAELELFKHPITLVAMIVRGFDGKRKSFYSRYRTLIIPNSLQGASYKCRT